MQTVTVKLAELNEHPAQMRTTLDVEGMASLTLQVYTRGLDPHQPIVVSRNGSDDGTVVISGHRRWLARLLAHELAGVLAHEMVKEGNDGDGSADLDEARSVVSQWAAKDGGLIAAYGPLTEKHGDLTVDVALFEGDEKAQVLALQSANFSQEEPDMLGQARSFQAAVEAGASPKEIAANVGKSTHYVANYLAVVEMPDALVQLIVDGTLGMGVARPIASLPKDKRDGLAAIVVARAGRTPAPTVAAVKAAAQRLDKWPGVRVPLTVLDAATRNRARIMQASWNKVTGAKPLRAWGVAADAAYQGVLGEPWADARICAAWVAALSPESGYVENGRADWKRLMVELVPNVGCATCPVAQLPYPPLAQDLALPCRPVATAEERPGACLDGIGEHDPCLVGVPMTWAGLPGVSANRPYTCASREDLEAAWVAQKEREEAEAQAEAQAKVETGNTNPKGAGVSPAAPAAGQDGASQAQSDKPQGPRPIDQQRAVIRSYMNHHVELAAEHPWATLCAVCEHMRADSPTKDPSVPPCDWAARLKSVEFLVRAPVGDNGPRIPLCRQFVPKDLPWKQLIPAHPAPSSLSRSWMLEQIQHLVKDGHNACGVGRTMLEFMTGRPIQSVAGGHKGWFLQELEKQVGDLSDEQVQTLFVWIVSDWRRIKADGYGGNKQYPIPVGPTGVQFVPYHESRWTDEFAPEFPSPAPKVEGKDENKDEK